MSTKFQKSMLFRLLPLLIISGLTLSAKAQLVSSFCSAPEQIILQYSDDASRLSLRNTFRNKTNWTDSAVINPTLQDTMVKALLAVYNAKALPASDTVVLLNIHTWPDIALRDFYVRADSNISWAQELYKGNLATGFGSVDSLINLYGMAYRYSTYQSHSNSFSIELKTKDNQNLRTITDAFQGLAGVQRANQSGSTAGDGLNIKDSIYPGYVQLIYEYGWGDCPLGCLHTRYWEFRVYPGCMVEYRGSYGDVLPANILSLQDLNSENIQVSPNPFTDHLKVSGASDGSSYVLYNLTGQKVQAGLINHEQIEINIQLPPAPYFLKMQSKGGEQSAIYKLVKK